MRRPYQITGALVVGLAAFVAYEALQLRYYTSLGPGPGFFSFWLALVLGVLGALMILQASLRPAERMPDDFFADQTGYLRIGAVALSLLFTVFALERLGFALTMLFVCVFLLYVLRQRSILVMLAVSLASGFGVYYVFVRWLNVPLPKGVLGF